TSVPRSSSASSWVRSACSSVRRLAAISDAEIWRAAAAIPAISGYAASSSRRVGGRSAGVSRSSEPVVGSASWYASGAGRGGISPRDRRTGAPAGWGSGRSGGAGSARSARSVRSAASSDDGPGSGDGLGRGSGDGLGRAGGGEGRAGGGEGRAGGGEGRAGGGEGRAG